LVSIIVAGNETLVYEDAIANIQGGNDVKARREAVPKLSTGVVDYNKKRAEHLAEMITNHQRLKFMDELLWHVVEYADLNFGATAAGKEGRLLSAAFWDANGVTRLIKSVCQDQLRLVVEPFDRLNVDGDISDLYEKFPLLIRLISLGRKPKIVRACLGLLAQLIHMIKNRPDMMRQIAQIAPFTNELTIELHNSTLSRRVKMLEGIFSQIRDESVQCSRIRHMFKGVRDVLELNKLLSFEDNALEESDIDSSVDSDDESRSTSSSSIDTSDGEEEEEEKKDD
jgi:hypothetical protein